MLSHWAAESNSSPADVQAAVRDSCFAVWHAGSWLTGARGTVRQLAMRGLMGMGMESTWGTMRRIRSCRKPSGAACAPELQVWLLMCAQTHEWMRMTTLICCIDKLLALMQPCLPDGTVLRQHLQLTSTRSQRSRKFSALCCSAASTYACSLRNRHSRPIGIPSSSFPLKAFIAWTAAELPCS